MGNVDNAATGLRSNENAFVAWQRNSSLTKSSPASRTWIDEPWWPRSILAPVPGLCRVAILPKVHFVIGESSSTRELEKLLCRYFNNISVCILVLSGPPFAPMPKVASHQSHSAPSDRGARWE